MKKLLLASVFFALCVSSNARAKDDLNGLPPEAIRDWNKLSDEQKESYRNNVKEKSKHVSEAKKQEMKQKIKERWDAMPEARKEQIRARIKEKMDKLSPEEREKIKMEMIGDPATEKPSDGDK
jgi:N12 class adenine-specific DNA methylase